MANYELFAGGDLTGIHLALGDGSMDATGMALSKTSLAFSDEIKTLTVNIDGISSTGALSLGTATVDLTTDSTAITQAPLNNSTKVSTTAYVDTAISAIPASTTPSLQAVINVNDDLQATAPTLDQVIKYDGTNVVWGTLPAPPASQSLQDVLDKGNTANKIIVLSDGEDTNTSRYSKIDIVGTDGTIATYGKFGVALTEIVSGQRKESSFGSDGGLVIANTVTKNTAQITDLSSSLFNDTTHQHRTLSSSLGLEQEINDDDIALGTKSLLSNSTLTLTNKATSATNTITSSSSEITDGTNTLTTAPNSIILNDTIKRLTLNADGFSSTGNLSVGSTGSTTTNIGNTGLTTINGSSVNINTLLGSDTTIGKAGSGTTSLNNPTVNVGRVGSSTTTVRGVTVNMTGTTNNITGTTNINISGTSETNIGNASSTTTINSLTASLTTTSTAITKAPLNNSTAVATTQYVDTAISSIPVSATPTLQSVINVNDDLQGLTPTLDQVIKYNGTNVLWSDLPSIGLPEVLAENNTADGSIILINTPVFPALPVSNTIDRSSMTITDGQITNTLLSTEVLISDGTNQGLFSNLALSFTSPNDVFAIDASEFSLANTGGTISNIQTKQSIILSNTTDSITFNPASLTYNGTTTNWSDIGGGGGSQSLQDVINVSDDLQSSAPTLNQIIKYNGTNVVWSDIPVIADGSTTTAKLADSSVTTNKIADLNVTTNKIADGNVTNAKLNKSGIPLSGFGIPIGEVSMGNQRITNLTNPNLAQDAATKSYVDAITPITTAKLADSSVTTSKIADANVTNAKLDKANIPLNGFGAPVASVSLGSQKIINLANPTLPQDGATKAYVDAIPAPTIPDGSITTAKLADSSVTTLKIADLNVTTAKLADSSVTNLKIAPASVTNSKLDKAFIQLSGFGDPITNVSLGNQRIINLTDPVSAQDGATKAYVDAITPITTAKLADNSVTTSKIADANVTNAKLNKIAIPLSGFGLPTATVSFGNQRLNELANPIATQDAATKAYVDSVIPNTSSFATLAGQNTFANVLPQIFTAGGISLNDIVASGVSTIQNIFTTKVGGTVNIGSTSSTSTLNGLLNLGTFGVSLNMKNVQTLDYTNAGNSSILNTITPTTGTNVNIDLTRLGQTQLIYRSTNSAPIPNILDTVLFTTTVLKTGIYTLSYQARYSATSAASVAKNVGTWVSVSSPTEYNVTMALNLVGYASPFLALQATGVSMTSTWTGLINANATVALTCFIEYNTTSATGILLSGIASNYLTFTRIA